ncbi:MAG: sigma-70 family RNA polymerase sigma factor [Planctomycetes bacterium]|nr:sigma-70 family RNA polymerase sigma factor [Planctomycetota bacterium]
MKPELLIELIDRHAAPLELLAGRRCVSPADVVQEAFLELAQQAEPPRNPVAWLYRAVRNRAISASRSERRRQRHELLAARGAAAWFEASAEAAFDARLASEAMDALPEEQREVIVARLWGGLSFEEIAEALDTSSSTAHRRYMAGLEALRERLGVIWLVKHGPPTS